MDSDVSVITLQLHTNAAAATYSDIGLMIQILLPMCHQSAYICACTMHALR